ncbi:MAG: hypothetical protein KME41_03670 [Candidatus Thiodiazotropha sp. (ex Lucina pensylvanica)]|nr:hypothetical protein [Candidatus Thiodiazotropha sp. (ex Lucina pensylvanica)]MBT3033270.1 hypothetical protein [Candidatus Thiodiazotropha sp. (ex Lucina pensylvanica)]MBV2119489.1 hypothetical protein [Candidatus Thiodiazotropha sp. (ex Lucina aurantia)]
MSDNAIITPEMITNESLRLLHDKLPFVSRINRRYSDEFKQGGARRGDDEVLVRFPNRYVVRDGPRLQAQSTEESAAYLKLTEQKGVDLEVTSKDLTLHIDDFSRRYLDPAMSTLASTIEEDVLQATLAEVVHVIHPQEMLPMPDWYDGMSLLGAWFDVNLIPSDQRRLVMNSYDQAEMVDSLKGYAQGDASVSHQYETGRMKRFQGFDIGSSLSMPVRESRGRVETGDECGITPLDLAQAGDSFDTVNATELPGEEEMNPLPKPGDWITFAGVYPVHPETKDPVRLFGLKPFKVESVVGNKVTFTPRLVWAGPKQNAAGISGERFDAVMNKGTDGQHYYRWNVAFDPEAIAFVTADLALPKDVDFAHRSNHEGIGMRVVRKYNMQEDSFPCRIDVLYGRKLLRPDSVCLLVGNSDD